MKKSSFGNSSLVFVLMILAFQNFNANALLQEAGTISVDVVAGEKKNFTWLLQSDDDKPITVQISAEGIGSEFLSFPQSLQIEPKQIILVPIEVGVPLDYSGEMILSPTLVATKLGDANESTIINLQLAKTITIIINKNENMNIDEVIPPQITTDVPTEEDQVTASVNIVEQKNDTEPTNDEKGGGCLIATATYGTELAPQVQLLREMRDNTAFSTESGTVFMNGFNHFYYSFSPTIADWERQNPIFKEAIRIIITPMISTLSIMTLAEEGSEIQMITLGALVIGLNIGLYLVVPAAMINKLKK